MQADLKAFIILELLGVLFFAVVIFTACLSPQVKRYATWYSFCVSWIMSGLSYSLTLVVNAYSGPGGYSDSVSAEAQRACLSQAALIYASPALTGFTSLAMCLHVCLFVHAALNVPMTQVKTSITTLLVVGPYIVWITMFVVLFLLGQTHPQAVQLSPTGFYCHLKLPEPVTVSSSITIIATIGVTITETWMAIKVHQNRGHLTQTSHPMAFVVRVFLFGFVDLFTLAVGLLFLQPQPTRRDDVANCFLMSLVPMLVLVIFGSQKDIIQVWMFWKKPTVKAEDLLPDRNTPSNNDSETLGQFRRPPGHWRSSSQSYVESFRNSTQSSSTIRPSYPISETFANSRPISDSVYHYHWVEPPLNVEMEKGVIPIDNPV
ncbi:hypothetical protein BDP27DRAFT_458650 [Rhodocollybia butyracea]|uniref:Uncharacterized protein n=1 Tax=Rhodocollybia butyracea TaxID=206335 RepID=A0A9P5PT10_9AGAR|nr:hypothetical protein BDP27DRAFT_458650 [Rhodocollybia butyracea]